MQTVIIGFTGLAHSGKDTSADYLLSCLNQKHQVIKIALADQLKYICQRLVEMFYQRTLPIEDFYDLHKKELIRDDLPEFGGHPFKIRTLLQLIGTEICRDMISKSIWCNYLKEKYIDNNQYQYVIISDLRMPDEINFFKELEKSGLIKKFVCFRLKRSNRLQLTDNNQYHQTEQMVNQLSVNEDIINESTLTDLYRKLDQIITKNLT